MEKNSTEESTNPTEQVEQTTIVAPVAPERETPHALSEGAEQAPLAEKEDHQPPKPGGDADTELNTMLEQIGRYFSQQASQHDLEAISFSLRHLFSRVDFLYRQALPELGGWTVRAEKGKEAFIYQQTWLHLQAINRTLDRMAPLCHLLSDIIECLLDTLDNEELWLRTLEEDETCLLKEVPPPEKQAKHTGSFSQPGAIIAPTDAEIEEWERAVTTIMDRLLLWQEHHHKLIPFRQQLAHSPLATAHLDTLDKAFAVLLDSAGAIFGDILPNFRLVEPGNQEEVSALLFDLMQQSDQMLVQFEVTLEPLTSLLRHFNAASENS